MIERVPHIEDRPAVELPHHRETRMSVNLVKDPTGAPAVDLTTLSDQHIDLRKRAEKAGISLSKRGLDGIRGRVIMLLDHSGSMHAGYSGGLVQKLVERALGFALQIDSDGQVEVIPFDSRMWPTTLVDVGNYQGVTDRDLWRRREMGGTNMAAPFRHIEALAKASSEPIFLIVIGDGSPADRAATTKAVCDLAEQPVFIKFLAIAPVDYLQELDDLPSGRRGIFSKRGAARLLDNVDAKFIADPGGMPDLAFADAMVDEWDSWITAATEAGILQ